MYYKSERELTVSAFLITWLVLVLANERLYPEQCDQSEQGRHHAILVFRVMRFVDRFHYSCPGATYICYIFVFIS